MQQQQLRDLLDAGNGEAVDALLMNDRYLLSVRYDAPCRLKRPSTGRAFSILHPTPLMMAVANWFPAVVRLLICWEAHVDDVFEMREPPGGDEGEETVVHFVTPLMVAAMTGRLEHCRALLDGGAQVNARDSLGRTALYHACCEGHLTVADLLIYESANVEAADENLVTPLMAACANGHTSVVFHLVSVAAKLDKTDKNGQNVLFYAARGGVPNILEYLVDQSDNLLHRDKQQRTLLMIAAAGGHENVVEHLIAQPTDYDLCLDADVDSEGRNTLFYAVLSKQLVVLKRLFQLSLPVLPSRSGETLLMTAARHSTPEMVQFLVENADTVDLDIQAADRAGENALFHAAANPDWAVFRFLAKAGVQVARNARGASPLMAAVRQGNASLLRHLLETRHLVAPYGDLSLDHVDEEGEDVLHYAARHGDVPLLQLLVRHGARPRLNRKQQTLLMTACGSGKIAMVRAVVELAPVDAEQRDSDGRNLLFHCVQGGCLEALRHFDQRAVRQPDANGVTLVMVAAAAGHANILKYLIDTAPDASAWLGAEDADGRNALFFAVSSGSEGILQLLLTAGCPLVPDRLGRSPLMEAARQGAADVVRFFLEHATQLGLDPSAEDAHGHSVVFFAAESGNTEILRACRARGIAGGADSGAALLHAARHNSLRFAHHLLDELASPAKCQDEATGENALFAALRGAHFVAVRELAARGVPVRANKEGRSPIAELYAQGEAALAEELLARAGPGAGAAELLNGRDLGAAGRTTFHHLALRGSVDRLRAARPMFEATKDRDAASGATLLMVAAANCRPELVELVLDEFLVDIGAEDRAGRDALTVAAQAARLDNLKLLLAYGAPLRTASRVGTVLAAAVAGGSERLFRHVVKFFLGATANPDLRREVARGLAPVVEAIAARGAVGMLRSAFEFLVPDVLAAPVNANGEFAHHVAARAGHVDALDVCLHLAPAGASARDAKGNNPLHAACASSTLSFSVVARLLEAGVDPEAPNGEGDTPLQLAVQRRILKAVRLLVEAGADPWRQNKRGLNAFDLCVSENSVIQVFLEKNFGLTNRQRHEFESLLPNLRALDLDALAADLAVHGAVLCEHNARQIDASADQAAKLALLARLMKRRGRGRIGEFCARLALHNEALAHELQARLTACEAAEAAS